MRTGKLRHKAELQKPTVNPERRASKQIFEKVDDIWCSIRQSKVFEGDKNKQSVVVGDYEIRIWKIPNEPIDETYRIKFENQIYNFVSVDQPNTLSRELVIIAKRNKIKE
jgi:head-tail adaptor